MNIFAPGLHKYSKMENKSQRLQAIKRIISTEKITSQEELLQKLTAEGYELTQATVSRDLKHLQAGKKPDPEKRSVFFISEPEKDPGTSETIDSKLMLSAIRSVLFANNFGVIKTLPGYASSIAVHIDKHNRFEIIGTIAGDDTILLIPGQDVSHSQMKNALRLIFPGMGDHYFRQA